VFDLGGGGTLDFFQADANSVEGARDTVGGLNHLALTTEPAFILTVEERLKARNWDYRPDERAGQFTIYFKDPRSITLQLDSSTGGTRSD